jgi:DNA-binding LytR/AlgR family response regulator
MKVKLICSESSKSELVGLLSYKNIEIVGDSNIVIVESGFPIQDDAVSIVFKKENILKILELLDSISNRNEDNNTIIGRKDDHNFEIIPFREILYFEGRGNYAYCITETGKYRIKEKLYELEKKLMNSEFIRVGKSFIVNTKNIKEIIPWFGRRLLLKFKDNKSEIEVSKNYVKSFKSHLGI